MKVVLLTKDRAVHRLVHALAISVFGSTLKVITGTGTVDDLIDCDWLVSFYGGWVVPAEGLRRVRRAAINVHPGSPDYPGFACYNLALYEGASSYGVTVHHMEPTIDSGAIISIHGVPIYDEDSVFTLQSRTEAVALGLMPGLFDAVRRDNQVLADKNHPAYRLNPHGWTRKASTRHDLDRLRTIDSSMSNEEVQRRMRAINYPGKPGLVVAS